MSIDIDWINERHENPQEVTEHGQEWISCLACGAIWSVVETENGTELEEIEPGDDSCNGGDV